MMGSLRTEGECATRAVGHALAPLVQAGDVVLLSGDLGAGKTAFVKGLAEGLDVAGQVTSPTFNILLSHPGRIPLHHIDLYRLDEVRQLEDIDYFGVLEADGVTAVEWGDRFPEAAPPDHLDVRMSIISDTCRDLEILPVGPRSETIAARWLTTCASLPGVEVRR